MFGFTGINGNAVFNRAILSLCLIGCPLEAYAVTFNSKDLFDGCSTLQQKLNVADGGKILVFINPQCSWCKKALENLDMFRKRNPHILITVYVMATLKEFVDFFHEQISGLPEDLEYSLDFKNLLADTYGITKTPTYIIVNQGQIQKVEGYVDLAHLDLFHHS
jgi:thioredoxin-related protein